MVLTTLKRNQIPETRDSNRSTCELFGGGEVAECPEAGRSVVTHGDG